MTAPAWYKPIAMPNSALPQNVCRPSPKLVQRIDSDARGSTTSCSGGLLPFKYIWSGSSASDLDLYDSESESEFYI